MASPVLQFKRGSSTNVGLASFKAGEPGFTTDKFDFYIGLDATAANQKFFGSARYWTRETGSTAALLKLVDKGGSNSINLKSPDTLTGTGGTYTLPDTSTIQAGYFLKVASDGTLSWDTVTAAASFSNSTLTGVTTITGSLNNQASTTNSGITTFTNTTDNTLGNSNTGAVQIDGGVGIDKNLTVGGGLNVQGTSEFIGVVTFRGGTINIGDSTTDNINVSGEFISNLTPDVTNTYNIGISTQQWKDAFFAGIGSFANVRIVNNLFDSSNSAGTSGQFLTVSGSGIGWTTISGVAAGTISTATRATLVDTTTAPNGTFYPGLFVNSTGTASTAVYVDSGISYVSNTDTLTLTGDIAVNGGDVTTNAATATVFDTGATTATAFGQASSVGIGSTTGTLTLRPSTVVGTNATQNLYNTVATTVNAFGQASSIGIGSATGTVTIGNPTLTLTNGSTVNVNGANPTLASSSTGTLTLFNTNLAAVNAFGAATSLVMGNASGIATINNATLTLPNATAVNVNGANPTLASSSTGTLTLFNTNLAAVNAFGAATSINIGASTGITTVRNSLRVTNQLYDSSNSAGTGGQFLTVTGAGIGWTTISGVSAGTISTAARANTVDTTTTTNNTNYFIPFVTNNAGTNGETVRVGAALSINPSTNTLTVPNVQHSTIKALDGTSAITISNTTGDVAIAGNLYINGSTTQVNTSELQVYDRTITLGIQSGTTPATTSWDLGILMNYGDAGVARTAGFIWDYQTQRFKFATNSDNPSGTSISTPQIGITTYAPIEVSELWVNNSCVSNTPTRIVGCTGGVLVLTDVTIDAGSF